ncbi:hypothetical protein OVA07_11120 [Novosphingobium sp. SL115]|uniref:hypothetical protein n=1 Tax=Novosphingobium sp. SL115 TaxID=2995150 RepID=UPI002273AA50|nr:hypothetical protein [Novosphingobium sp. SL115]MCY1671558.1 hypothetical protein [Novosphingobium sp. SL115]
MTEALANVRASIDNSGTKPQLVVDGSVMVYASDYSIKAEKAIPESFNPSIALIRVFVEERPSPMKGVMRPFSLRTPMKNEWQSVQVDFVYNPEEGSEGRIQNVSAPISE